MGYEGFPTADQIALAIVTAARLTGEDPEAVLRGEYGVRARVYAMSGLLLAFPKARRVGLGECLGYPTPRAAQASVISSSNTKGWREEWADEVLGALVAPLYGEGAA
jgi:hypothetical protein